MPSQNTLHYTDLAGHNAIGSQPIWRFVAAQPPGDRPVGAYFTNLGPDTPNLAQRLRIPRTKLEFQFCFASSDDFEPLRGGRGAYIFYSPTDYLVDPPRQQYRGTSLDAPEACR